MVPASAYWNNPAAGFGAKQGAAFTFANVTNGASLVLGANGTAILGVLPNFIRVQYSTAAGGRVVIQTTANYGVTYATAGTLITNFATGNTLTAMVDASGTVYVWKTAGATTTFIGSATTTFTAGGQIGILLPSSARVDNFSGGNVP
jgi:hypothetical protein